MNKNYFRYAVYVWDDQHGWMMMHLFSQMETVEVFLSFYEMTDKEAYYIAW